MTNAERLVLLKRAQHELERVREEIAVPMLSCPGCDYLFCPDKEAPKLSQDLETVSVTLSTWIKKLGKSKPTSDRVSSET